MPPCQAFIHSLVSPSLPSMSTVSSSPLTTHMRESLHLPVGSPGAQTGCYIPLVYLMVLLPSWSCQESELGTPQPQVCDLRTMLAATVFCVAVSYFVTLALLPPSHGLGTAKMNFPSHFQWLFEIILLGGSHLDNCQSPDTDRRGQESKQHQYRLQITTRLPITLQSRAAASCSTRTCLLKHGITLKAPGCHEASSGWSLVPHQY